MDIEIRHVKLMDYVARESSISKAATYLYLTQIESFHTEHLHVAVTINTDVTHRSLTALLNGELDLALVNSHRNHARLEYTPLFACPSRIHHPMNLLPDWAPNVHPLIVHFPIALLVAAMLLDLGALVFRKQRGLLVGAMALYVLGAVSALATYFTGRAAADSVSPSGAANTVLTEHADWALWTLLFFGVYAIVRLVVWRMETERLAVQVPLFLVGAAGLLLLWETAEHGAQMVYEHGVGVQAVATLDSLTRQQEMALDQLRAQEAGPVEADGAWRWTPGDYAPAALASSFRWVEGSADVLQPDTAASTEHGTVLRLQPQDTSALFVYDLPTRSLQADVTLNRDGFEGTLMIVHHVQDAQHYGFLALDGGTMRLGRVTNGQVEVMDEQPFEGSGWQMIRVVADKTHFRGYADGTLVVHGHGAEADPGAVGLRLDGTGPMLLGRIDVQALR